MQKLNQTLEHRSTDGWIVHIYAGNRRLLCALDSSHGWSFFAGISLGLLVAVMSYTLTESSQPQTDSTAPSDTPTVPIALPMGID